MGQTLSHPVTDKTTEQGGDSRYIYGVSEMQGWRASMEDSHIAVLSLDKNAKNPNSFFAVYDGHGGSTVAKYAGENVHKRLTADKAYQNAQYQAALKNAFLGVDVDIQEDPQYRREQSGCTAVAALITREGKIYVANAGDSRTIISVKGEAEALSNDHKPQNDDERARIIAAGGYIEYGRVNGNLALSRALGDFEYKKNPRLPAEAQIITCDPEIMVHDVTDEDEFLILACDGIWDCLTSQQAVDVVRHLIAEGKKLPEVCEEICELCLAPDTAPQGAGIGCDNMTIMIVAILHGKTPEEWYQWVTDRVDKKYGHDTPRTLPQMYSAARMMSFRERRARWDERKREWLAQRSRDDDPRSFQPQPDTTSVADLLSRFSQIQNLRLVNINDEDDDDIDVDGDEDYEDAAPMHTDEVKSLREQVEELERDEDMHSGDDVHISESEQSADNSANGHELQGEAPPPPRPVNGGPSIVEQLSRLPDGESASDAVKAEGLLDTSDSIALKM